jgi:hypothetical protein
MLNYKQFYEWYNNRYSKDVLYKVYRNGFLIGMGFYDGVTMQTLSDSVYNLKHVTFIKKQCIISSFRFIFNDKIDETYALIPATIEDIRLITTAIQMVSNTIGHDEGYNKEYGLEMINEYARVLGDLSIQEVIDKFKN